MRYVQRITLKLKVKLVHVGVSDTGLIPRNLKAPRNGKKGKEEEALEVLSMLTKYYDEILKMKNVDTCKLLELLSIVKLGKSILASERSIISEAGHRIVDYVVLGSSVRGVLRSTFDSLLLDAVVWHERLPLLADAEFIEKVTREFSNYSEVSTRELIRHITGTTKVEEQPKHLVKSLKALYLIASTPYTCTSVHPLSCKIPRPHHEFEALRRLNKLLAERGLKHTCLEVSHEKHCVPLTRICLSCLLWGCAGISSHISFGTFKLTYKDIAIATFNRVITSRLGSLVSPFTIEIVGFKEPVELIGDVYITANTPKVKALIRQSYLEPALNSLREYVTVLERNSRSILERLIKTLDKLCKAESSRDIASAYHDLISILLEHLKDQRVFVLGGKRNVGFGSLIDFQLTGLED